MVEIVANFAAEHTYPSAHDLARAHTQAHYDHDHDHACSSRPSSESTLLPLRLPIRILRHLGMIMSTCLRIRVLVHTTDNADLATSMNAWPQGVFTSTPIPLPTAILICFSDHRNQGPIHILVPGPLCDLTLVSVLLLKKTQFAAD